MQSKTIIAVVFLIGTLVLFKLYVKNPEPPKKETFTVTVNSVIDFSKGSGKKAPKSAAVVLGGKIIFAEVERSVAIEEGDLAALEIEYFPDGSPKKYLIVGSSNDTEE